MRYNEILAAMPTINEAERVPTLAQLWKYSDEFSPEANERARQAALKHIADLRKKNKEEAESKKQARLSFKPQNVLELLGFDIQVFMHDYCVELLQFFKDYPKAVPEFVLDPATVNEDNIFTELLRKVQADGSSNPVGQTVLNALYEPGPDLEAKYQEGLDRFFTYWNAVKNLGPVGRKKAESDLLNQLASSIH